ncbi:OOP family OmpA-OmpF porin [Catenulispora sp. MAP12-49]|uniref:OmpA family protein n=1 Tax=unclassified Catenulispora TaxID=414885 RepID=UPI0035120F3A
MTVMTIATARHAWVALLLAVTGTVSGCGFFTGSADAAPQQQPVAMSCPGTGSAPLTLVVGAHANSPQPELPPQIRTLVHDAALAGQDVQVELLDGTPATVQDRHFSSSSQNPRIKERDLDRFVADTGAAVSALRPSAPQVDFLTGLSVAGQHTPAGGTIVVLDSGVATAGPVSFQDQAMFGVDPAEVAKYLDAQHLTPDLRGKAVVFVDLGQTAGPQPMFEQNVQTQINALWTTIAKDAGASCQTTVQVTHPQTSVPTAVPVAVVRPQAPPAFDSCGTTTLGDEGSVGFVAGSSDFRDPAVAKTTLSSLARLLAGHTQQVRLIGSVSSDGSPSVDHILSLSRAEAVKNVLVDLGVDPSRITTEGDGEAAGPGHVPDRTATGSLIPWAAERNRSVTVILTCRS